MRMWRLWAGVWDGELPRADYVRMRIAVGLMWVAVYATLVPNMTMLFDGELGLPLATMRGRYGGNHIAWFDGIHGWQVPALVYGGMAAAGLFTVGVLPRVAGVVAYLIHLGLQHRCFTWMDGSDDLARMLLAFMLLAPLGRRSATLPAWPLRLCQLQVAVMYLATAAWKAAGSDWPGGTALYWALSDPRWQRLNLDLVLSSQLGQLGLSLATLGTLVVEFAMPVLLLWPRTRRAAVLLGLALHLGILATMRVGLFTPMVMASYAAFWTGPWWPPRRWLVQAWRDLRAPRSTPSSQASPRAMS
jgi:hypothetical protein